ncbi:hypothetical protein [Pedobacter steynii]|uniref:hypothetical protein n=1 Tax=Pedobacter steynii TaxID=430522 RepID=UPI003B58B28A
MKTVRDNMPFGSRSKNEVGSCFMAYAGKFNTVHRKYIQYFFMVIQNRIYILRFY